MIDRMNDSNLNTFRQMRDCDQLANKLRAHKLSEIFVNMETITSGNMLLFSFGISQIVPDDLAIDQSESLLLQ